MSTASVSSSWRSCQADGWLIRTGHKGSTTSWSGPSPTLRTRGGSSMWWTPDSKGSTLSIKPWERAISPSIAYLQMPSSGLTWMMWWGNWSSSMPETIITLTITEQTLVEVRLQDLKVRLQNLKQGHLLILGLLFHLFLPHKKVSRCSCSLFYGIVRCLNIFFFPISKCTVPRMVEAAANSTQSLKLVVLPETVLQ